MPRRKKSDILASRIRVTQILLYLNTFVWLCFGAYMVLDMLYQGNPIPAALAAFFLLVNVAAMYISGVNLGKHEKWAYYFSLTTLIVNAAVTRAGAFGAFDQLAFVLDLIILVFLVSFGGAYLRS